MSKLSNILRDAIKVEKEDSAYDKLSAREKKQMNKLFLIMNVCSDEIERLEARNARLLVALVDLLNDYKEMQKQYSADRERDGWNPIEEDMSAANARAVLAAEKKEQNK